MLEDLGHPETGELLALAVSRNSITKDIDGVADETLKLL
jgi:hypothetical protein